MDDRSMVGPADDRTRRAGRYELAGGRRSNEVAMRLGTALREAREGAGLPQAIVAARAGLTQPHVSWLEHGKGTGASVETWSRVAAAVGEQLVAFLDHAPGADRPRDFEHLKRQSALISIAVAGGWRALPELSIDPGRPRSRSIDVALVRAATREVIVVEIWNWFEDVGGALRGLDAKTGSLATRLGLEVG
jgi:transcriptional regulator with XRE-family HTH domain